MPIYVDSNASGANDGTSWTDAYTSIASTTGAAAGSEIWVERNHAEQPTAHVDLTLTNSTRNNPLKWFCIDKSDDSLVVSGTRSIIGSSTAAGYRFRTFNSLHAIGIEFIGGLAPEFLPSSASQHRVSCENCTFQSLSNPLTIGDRLRGIDAILTDCEFKNASGGSWNSIIIEDASRVLIRRPTLPATPSNPLIQPQGSIENTPQYITVEDANLSEFSTLISKQTLGWGDIVFRRCNLKSSYTVFSATPNSNQRAIIESSGGGTITVPPLGLVHMENSLGTAKTVLSRYRTGGADDGEQANAYSWEMVTNANAVEIYNNLESPPITRWVDGGSEITVTVYVASSGTLNDDDFWVELSGPSNAGSATAQGYFESTRMTPRSTPIALTTDASSTWNGSGVGTQQQIDITYTPTISGPLTIRCFLAKPSTTVYVDPKIEVT